MVRLAAEYIFTRETAYARQESRSAQPCAFSTKVESRGGMRVTPSRESIRRRLSGRARLSRWEYVSGALY